MTEKYKVELEDFHANVVTSFKNLKSETYFHDVTLFSGDLEPVSAHKVVLSSSSDYFSNILKKTNVNNPCLCLEDITRSELENVLDYVYLGEVQLQQEQLDRFLCLAQRLKLKGISYDEKEKETYKDMSQNKNQKSFKTEINSYDNDEPPSSSSAPSVTTTTGHEPVLNVTSVGFGLFYSTDNSYKQPNQKPKKKTQVNTVAMTVCQE